MDLSLELEKNFKDLERRCLRVAYSHYFTKEDAEDLVQEVCLAILEDQVPMDHWGKVITKQLGLARTQRTRKGERETDLPDEVAYSN